MAKKRTKLVCEVRPARLMGYGTVGDYLEEKGGMVRIVSADMGFVPSALCLIHELIEYIWIKQAGVTVKETVDWDIAHLESDDPGSIPGCPYGVGHRFALNKEKQIAQFLGLREEEWR